MDRWLALAPMIVGALVLLVVSIAALSPARRPARTAVLLAGSVGGILLLTLVEGGQGQGGINLVPGSTIEAQLTNPSYPLAALNLLGNVAVFVPLGWLVAMLATRHRLLLGASAGIGLSLAIEGTQSLVGRVADVDDVILNGLGAALGAGLAVLVTLARDAAPRALAPAYAAPTSAPRSAAPAARSR